MHSTMTMSNRIKLSAMMLFQFMLFAVFWSQLATYLDKIGVSGLSKSLILSSMAIGLLAMVLRYVAFHLGVVYEGCVFSHNWHLDRLCKFRPRPEAVSLTGGASKSQVWVRMFADSFQLPVEVPEGTELGALGAARAAAVACGVHGSYEQAVAAMTRVARRKEPDRALAEVYAARYRKYRAAVTALGPFFKPSTI